ncbi:HAD-IA family hydrolase [Verrucomicrobiaceae bacterium N1E253]|uniref:HAD-IA family hydrolase n=1 Tax=Oceaniferula marina TaxID=2748318 RepID=A0A851GQI4_9BACT|nr:HAD-IA family hydrolase [Oceaniferula marina]NWK56424.1 HAD-IA family hydrolase [Oceaniferula marina]
MFHHQQQEIQEVIHNAKAVLFDFDGIILDSEWPIYQSWKRLFKREGHTLEQKMYVNCIGSDFETWSPPNYLEELTGKHFDWEKENAARQVEIMRDLESAEPMPGVRDLVIALSEKPTAVVSSSSHRWVDGWLEKLDLMPHFNTTVCRGDAPKIKPAPDLFLEGARQLDTAPSECLVIEDSINGLLAAHQATMKVLAVPNRLTHILDFSAADWRAKSLKGLA